MSITVCFAGGNHRKRILVTGASGGIGRELVRQLKTQPDADVVSLNSVDGHRVDLKDKARLGQLLQQQDFDTVYHLAALNPAKSSRGEDYFETNVQGTENLLNGVLALKKQGKKMPDVFLASSALVYEPQEIRLTDAQTSSPLRESALDATVNLAHQKVEQAKPAEGAIGEALLKAYHLGKPNVFYNDSKLLAEMTAGEYARQGVPIKVGRLVNCYGKASNQLMNQLVHEVKQGKALTLQGKDSEPRDYLFCDGESADDDVLRLIRAVAEKGKAGEAYNISSGGQFVRSPQTIAALAQGKKVSAGDNAKGMDSKAVLSNEKLLALGVNPPKTSPEAGLKILRAHEKINEKGFFGRIGQWFSSLFGKIKSWFSKFLKFGKAKRQPV